MCDMTHTQHHHHPIDLGLQTLTMTKKISMPWPTLTINRGPIGSQVYGLKSTAERVLLEKYLSTQHVFKRQRQEIFQKSCTNIGKKFFGEFLLSTYDSVLGKRVLTYWEIWGKIGEIVIAARLISSWQVWQTIYFWKGKDLTFPKIYNLPWVLQRYSSSCNQYVP